MTNLPKNKRYDYLYPRGVPLRQIQESSQRKKMERRDGIGNFLDIEKAVASPGEEIDHDTDGYYIHRDYNTTVRLNDYLKTGKTQFYVRYLGETHELTIKKP
jgi:hypothetical protein